MNMRLGAALACLTLGLLWGCSSPDAPPASPTGAGTPAVASAPVGIADGSALTVTPAGLTLGLLPSAPTVLEDLEAQIGGVTGGVEFRWDINGLPIAGQTGSRLPAGLAKRGDRVTVVARAAEGEVGAQVEIVNSLPRVSQVRLKELRVYRGVDLAVEPQGVDPDGDSLSYRYQWLVNGEELHWEQGAALSGDKFRRGDKVVLRVTPNDGKDNGPIFQGLEIAIPNGPPKFVSEPPRQFQGPAYQYQLRVEDPDGDSLTYSLEAGPKGMEIDSKSGLLSWSFGKKDSGDHRIRIVVKDPEGLGTFQEYSLALTVPQ